MLEMQNTVFTIVSCENLPVIQLYVITSRGVHSFAAKSLRNRSGLLFTKIPAITRTTQQGQYCSGLNVRKAVSGILRDNYTMTTRGYED